MKAIIEQLQINKTIFYNLLKNESEAMFLWKQSPEKWCLLEILCHLYDEEREDFKFRVQWVLEQPNTIPPPFNPVDWVIERNYIGQNYNQVLNNFIAEREDSIAWLSSLKKPNWDHSFQHSKLGTITAGYFLTNWLAHDYLHLKQILKLKFDYLQHQSGESLNYAGTW